MAAGSARLTAGQGRRFGLVVGGAFLTLAAFAWWRDHPLLAFGLGAVGGALAIAGLVVPTGLGPVERGWMRLADLLSTVTTPVVMGAIYFLVVTPVGMLRRIFGGNPVVHHPGHGSFWRSRPAGTRTGILTRQF